MAKSERHDSPAGRRGKRVTLIVYVAFAAAFILLSTGQIARQVFGAASPGALASPACARAARAFEGEVDGALHHAGGAHVADDARTLFFDSLGHGESLSLVEHKCSTPGADADTLAAARRLHDAAVAAAMTQSESLARLRQSLEARTPAPPHIP